MPSGVSREVQNGVVQIQKDCRAPNCLLGVIVGHLIVGISVGDNGAEWGSRTNTKRLTDGNLEKMPSASWSAAPNSLLRLSLGFLLCLSWGAMIQ